jgi:glycosyltransferase involved in cell wall biosynthesis
MRIAVDAQVLGRSRGGDETYFRNLIRRYPRLRPDHEYWFYYTHPGAEPLLRNLPGCVHPRSLAVQNPLGRVPWAYLWRMWREPVDVFHTQYVGWTLGSAKLVLTVHDLSFEYFPETFPRVRALGLKMTRGSVRRAAAVIACSENTRRDLRRFYGVDEGKVYVIPEAADPMFSPCRMPGDLQKVRCRYGLRKPYILSVGTLQPRKNIPRLVQAFLQARQAPGFDLDLVLVGKEGWGPGLGLGSEAVEAGIRMTGYVPEDDLPVLYSGATAFVYPSLYEGFGLPVLEAMACGTAVITSNTSSLPEVAGDAAVYVDPSRTESLVQALLDVARRPAWRRELGERGLRRAQRFSWDDTARKTLAVYEAVAGPSAAEFSAVRDREPTTLPLEPAAEGAAIG